MKLRRTAALSALMLTLAACGGGSDDGDATDEATKGESSKVVEVSPLTGLEYTDGAPSNPVFVTKIENTSAGAPQYGLNQADLVVEELVEGGLTRLAAMYHTTLPSKVGHVRSLRGTDASIAAPVAGQVVASGGAPPSISVLQNAGITLHMEDGNVPGFSSDANKSRPYNRLVDLTVLAGAAQGADIPGPYFEFTKPAGEEEPAAEGDPAAAAPVAAPATSASVRFSPGHTTNWAFAEGKWTRSNGFAAPGEEFQADNLIVVFAPVGDAGYLDPAGNPVPETLFEGSGSGAILSGGQKIDVTWTKEGRAGTLKFTDAAGAPVTVNPGRTWIELVPDTGTLTAQ